MKLQVPSALEDLVDAARRDAPSDASLSSIAEAVENGPPSASRSRLPANASRSTSALASGLILMAACAVVAGTYALSVNELGKPAETPPAAVRPREAAPAPLELQGVSLSVAPAETTAVVPSIDVHSLPDPEKPPEARGEARGRVGAVPTARPEGPSEDVLLRRAHEAIATDPRHALELTAEHALRFPGGMLVQEREVIAIEALARMGRLDEARRRAATFFATYPSSAYRGRVNEAVEPR